MKAVLSIEQKCTLTQIKPQFLRVIRCCLWQSIYMQKKEFTIANRFKSFRYAFVGLWTSYSKIAGPIILHDYPVMRTRSRSNSGGKASSLRSVAGS